MYQLKGDIVQWWLLCALIVSAKPTYAQNASILSESKEQVKHYVQNIEQGRNTVLNIWALWKVGGGGKNIRTYIQNYLGRRNDTNGIFQSFRDTTRSPLPQLHEIVLSNGSPLLLVAYLLNEKDEHKRRNMVKKFEETYTYPHSNAIQYRSLIRALLHKKPVTSSVLSNDHFNAFHFLLFFAHHPIEEKLITKAYVQQAAKKWSKHDIYKVDDLNRSLYQFTLYRVHYILYDYKPTESFYHTLLSDQLFPNSGEKLRMLRTLDYSMYRLGYYNRSLNIIQHYSLPLADYLGEKNVASEIRISEGAYLYYIGRIDQSTKIYHEIKNGSAYQQGAVSRARVLNNLAITYFRSGEFDKYLNLLFQALDEAKKEDNYDLKLDIFKNLYIYYRINKNFNSAKKYLSRAKELAQKNRNEVDLAQLSYYEGQLYRDSESDLKAAEKYFNRALEYSTDNNYNLQQNVLTDKGRLFEKQKKYEAAKAIYQRVLAHARSRKDDRNTLFASFNKANVDLELHNLDSVRTVLDTLQSKPLGALDFYQLVKARTVQARFAKATENPQKGLQILQPVIAQILKRSGNSGDMETGFWQVEPEYLDAFEVYVNLLINGNQPRRAVETLDQLKTINDAALYRSPLIRSKVLNEKQLSDYKRYTDHLDELRRKLIAALPSKKDSIQQKIDKLSAKKNTLDQKINARANRKPMAVRSIQRGLDAHQRVLHITELNDVYYEAIIARTSVTFRKIPLTRKIRATFEKSTKQVAMGEPNLNNLYSVTKLLRLNRLPDHVRKLTIIPDSYLYQLPVDMLPLQAPEGSHSYGSVKYVIERFRTKYLTSLNDFDNSAEANPHYKYSFVGYGVSQFKANPQLVPLPEAKSEITSIMRQLTALNNKKMLLNRQATKSAFRQMAPEARILHLATHSMVDNNNPLFSSIYMEGSNDKKEGKYAGRIFAYQLFNLHLSNRLVMLNSCESGSGDYLQGTGVVGISRALRYAGAQSLVLNLWSVNDMLASSFATRFYKGINEGKTKSEALQDAKLYFLKYKNENPHYWGPYMLFGNNQAIVQPYKKTNRIAAISFALFFVTISLASSLIEIRRRLQS